MTTKIQNTPNRAAFDVRQAQDLRTEFQRNPQAGLKAAAQQFETLFLQMVMKSMRDSVPQDGMLNSDQSRFYTGLLDQQMAQNIATSGNGVGFARLIEQQLGRHVTSPEAASALNLPANAAGTPLPLSASNGQHITFQAVPSQLPTSAAYAQSRPVELKQGISPRLNDGPGEFAHQVWPHAVEASRSTGIPPQFLVAHAALESGWGKSEIRRADGTGTHNLFGIKAGKSWGGDTVDIATTEYVGGQAQTMVERFRAYPSYEEAFRDYANLLRNNPRYSGVIASQSGVEFAKRLQQAGYATDPMYAEKLAKIIDGPTLRQALIG